MNWSDYCRFVGDIFGAPLAMEGLLAFFLESTFLGLWIFGWDRLPKQLHLACIWLAVDRHHPVGLLHPRRQLLDAAPGRLGGQHRARPGRADRLRRGADQLHRRSARSRTPSPRAFADRRACSCSASARGTWRAAQHVEVIRPSLRLGAGHRADRRHRRRRHRRPAGPADDRAAADEDGRRRGALRHHRTRVVLAVHHRLARRDARRSGSIRVPGVLSFMATGSFDGKVEGINDLQQQYDAELRARRLHAEHPGDLLDVPADDRLRDAGRAAVGRRALAHPPRRAPGRCPAGSGRAAFAGLVLPVRRQQRRAGSSPRWAASPGRCSGCCRPPTASRRRSASPRC